MSKYICRVLNYVSPKFIYYEKTIKAFCSYCLRQNFKCCNVNKNPYMVQGSCLANAIQTVETQLILNSSILGSIVTTDKTRLKVSCWSRVTIKLN